MSGIRRMEEAMDIWTLGSTILERLGRLVSVAPSRHNEYLKLTPVTHSSDGEKHWVIEIDAITKPKEGLRVTAIGRRSAIARKDAAAIKSCLEELGVLNTQMIDQMLFIN